MFLYSQYVEIFKIFKHIWPTRLRYVLTIKLFLQEDRRSERRGWTLREVSLIHQKVLVIAEISWEARRLSRRPVYFVTWEVDGGGLKGNLFTDSTSVTLSLWPDTVYHIQVRDFTW